jgi:hypothetical protein
VFPRVVQIEVHRAGIRMGELADRQVLCGPATEVAKRCFTAANSLPRASPRHLISRLGVEPFPCSSLRPAVGLGSSES